MSNQNQHDNQNNYDYQISLNQNQTWSVISETERNSDGSISQTLEIIKRETWVDGSIEGESNHE